MERTSAVTEAQHSQQSRATSSLRTPAAVLIAGSLAFFAGSTILTQSGQPGASTPIPWLTSHALWFVGTGVVAVGATALLRRLPPAKTTLSDTVATGALGLATLTALQWFAWTYVDVFVYRHGEHELLHPTLLHPYGTAHALLYAVVLGVAVAALARRLARSEHTHRVLDWGGVALGVGSALAASGSLLVVLDVPHPIVLAVVLSIGASFGWVLVVGASVYRAA